MPGLTWDPRPGLPVGWNHILNKCMEPGWSQPVGCREPIWLLLTSRGHTCSMGSLHSAPLGSLQQARGRSRPSVEHDLPGGADLPLGQHRAASICGRWGPPLVEDARRGLSTRKSQALSQGQGESAWPCWPLRGQNPNSRRVPRARPGPLCLHHKPGAHSPATDPSTAPHHPQAGHQLHATVRAHDSHLVALPEQAGRSGGHSPAARPCTRARVAANCWRGQQYFHSPLGRARVAAGEALPSFSHVSYDTKCSRGLSRALTRFRWNPRWRPISE